MAPLVFSAKVTETVIPDMRHSELRSEDNLGSYFLKFDNARAFTGASVESVCSDWSRVLVNSSVSSITVLEASTWVYRNLLLTMSS